MTRAAIKTATQCAVIFLSLDIVAGAMRQKTTQAVLQPAAQRAAAPMLSLEATSGKRVSLSDFRGQPVVVNLWATNCGGCRAELPDFVRLYAVYQSKGLAVVGISMDILYDNLKGAREAWAVVKPFVATHGMKYPVVLDDGSAEKALKVTALPATYLLDRSGRIAATYIGVVDAGNLEANIKTLLAERRDPQ